MLRARQCTVTLCESRSPVRVERRESREMSFGLIARRTVQQAQSWCAQDGSKLRGAQDDFVAQSAAVSAETLRTLRTFQYSIL